MRLKKVYSKIFTPWYGYVEEELKDCTTVLDVGCGKDSPVQYFKSKKELVGIEAHEQAIKEAKRKKIHKEYYKRNVMDIDKLFAKNSFDAVIALDLIEHLSKKDGKKLINKMEDIAKKKVIVFTPNGFLPQAPYEGNPFQEHLSGWTVEEMKKRGYKVKGVNGYKRLRKSKGEIKYRPKIIWTIVSDISQWIVKNHPKKAFQIICTKRIEK